MKKNVVEVCEATWVPSISWNNPDSFDLPCVEEFPLLTDMREDFIYGIENLIEVMIQNEVLDRGLLLEEGDTISFPVNPYVNSFNFGSKIERKEEITQRVRNNLGEGTLSAIVTVIDSPRCTYEVSSYDGGPDKLTLSIYQLLVDLSFE